METLVQRYRYRHVAPLLAQGILVKWGMENLYKGFVEEECAVTGGVSMPRRGARRGFGLTRMR